MATLRENMEAIKLEKDTKVLPENIKKDVTIFGVVGTLEDTSEVESAKIFSTIEEMNASTENEEGDLAVINEIMARNIVKEDTNVTAYFPETVVVPTAVTTTSSFLGTIVGTGAYIKLLQTSATIQTSSFGGTILAKYTSTDGITYTRTTDAKTVTMASITSSNPNHYPFFAVEFRVFKGTYKYTNGVWEMVTNNQDKIVTPTTEEQTVTADSDYTGLGTVTVEGVTSAIDTNIVPENIKKDITILGVTGVLEQGSGGTVEGIKQFASVEEMNNSTGNEGDLACVYEMQLINMTASTEIQYIVFPQTVVLPEAITTSTYCMIMSKGSEWGDGSIELSATAFSCYFSSNYGGVSVSYTSSDGITYTRTDTNAETVDFGMPVGCASGYEDMWDNNFGYFAQIENPYFGGVYVFDGTSWVIAPTQLDATAEYIYDKTFYGQNGVETGTLQNIENLTLEQAMVKSNIWNALSSLKLDESITNFSFQRYTGTNMPYIDTSNCTVMSHCFTWCKYLTTIPLLNTSNVTLMDNMFAECSKLTTVPLLDTSKVTLMNNMFVGCSSLITIPQFDVTSVTNMGGMFNACSSLSDESLNNILAMCANANAYTATKTLKQLSLTSTQATTCTGLSNWSAASAAGWTTGY